MLEGHDVPCYYCGKPCNSFAGNPGLWPICLSHRDRPGVATWQHTACVQARLLENQDIASFLEKEISDIPSFQESK